MNANAWRVRVAYLVRRAGVPGWLGALCLLAALAFGVLEVLPAADRLTGVELRQAALQAQRARGPTAVALTPAQQLAAFYRDFAQGTTIPDVLARIYRLATDQKLPLELGEYAMHREQGAHLDQFRITLPVKGSYLQIRKFVGEVLLAQPALSLESLSLRREKVAQDAVDGRVVFLLFLERAP